MIESKKVWMYSTVGLAAILAVGFSFPQAFAHVSSNVPHVFQHLLDALAPLQADIDDIKETTDGLGFKAISLSLHPDPSDGELEEIDILPLAEGTAHQGHMQITLDANGGNEISLVCKTDDSGTVGVRIADKTGSGSESFERDFSCTSLTATIRDVADGNDAIFARVDGIVTYSETDDYTSLSTED